MLSHDAIEDMPEVVRPLEAQAPYDPLGSWYRPGADPRLRTRPMWFRNDAAERDERSRNPLSMQDVTSELDDGHHGRSGPLRGDDPARDPIWTKEVG